MKFYPLALLAMLMAASTASAGDYYSYGNSLASGGCQGHSWIHGCCQRQSSCADHLWDDYCANRGCGCGMHMPCINWNALHMNAAPYQVPCFHLPKLHLNHGCAADCCSPAPVCDQGCGGCDDSCAGDCGCGNPVKNWLHRLTHRAGKSCGCDSGCDDCCTSGGTMDYVPANGTMIHESAPVEAAPLPPAPTTEEQENKKPNNKKKENKTASLWLFPSFSL